MPELTKILHILHTGTGMLDLGYSNHYSVNADLLLLSTTLKKNEKYY